MATDLGPAVFVNSDIVWRFIVSILPQFPVDLLLVARYYSCFLTNSPIDYIILTRQKQRIS